MFTTETALESLRKFDIDETTLEEWEQDLGLSVPVDEYGRKQYSPHHINLFKNVKKHLALGRSLEQIKKIISLPPTQDARLQTASLNRPNGLKSYASVPKRATFQAQPPIPTTASGSDEGLMDLLNRVLAEKDQLQKKLMETEKLNSHLYNANSMFHRKVKEMTQQIAGLKTFIGQMQDKLKDNSNLKLLDDKNKLQKQLLDAERVNQTLEHELESKRNEIQSLQGKVEQAENRFNDMMENFDTSLFVGEWYETARLLEIMYDNFGINIETDRTRSYRIAEPPERIYGHTAMVTHHYEYETNNLWKRTEHLSISYVNTHRMEGELLAEYLLDGVPVAKAAYRVSYIRKQ